MGKQYKYEDADAGIVTNREKDLWPALFVVAFLGLLFLAFVYFW